MLTVKQGGTKYHFLSLWYDLTWDWTQVSWTIGEQSMKKMKTSVKAGYDTIFSISYLNSVLKFL